VRERHGAIYQRELDDGREITVYPLLWWGAKVCIGPADCPVGFDDSWLYREEGRALDIAKSWDGNGDPPDGWFRQTSTGRRRPGGDPAQEFISI